MVHVNPGELEPEDCDYWWSQEHDRRFFTFIDQYREGSQPEFFMQQSAAPRVRICAICSCTAFHGLTPMSVWNVLPILHRGISVLYIQSGIQVSLVRSLLDKNLKSDSGWPMPAVAVGCCR